MTEGSPQKGALSGLIPTCQGQETPNVPARGAARDGRGVWSELSFLGHLFLVSLTISLDDINHSKVLYDPPPKVTEIKTKVNKWALIKLKSFWEKILANAVTDEGLVSKLYKQLMELNNKNKTKPNQKLGRRSK